ncbi:hypothetical protein Nepgr_010440 [Nepenthes gracilis]|uniref:Uncharacterized protein n=1 Tax=Nepenthes gracilis TaxID=150966 RepID=A0AAD3SCG2_NEPGR|nr:hypothetical protein Nepgr_010440 [Nepenthes gracilis]
MPATRYPGYQHFPGQYSLASPTSRCSGSLRGLLGILSIWSGSSAPGVPSDANLRVDGLSSISKAAGHESSASDSDISPCSHSVDEIRGEGTSILRRRLAQMKTQFPHMESIQENGEMIEADPDIMSNEFRRTCELPNQQGWQWSFQGVPLFQVMSELRMVKGMIMDLN